MTIRFIRVAWPGRCSTDEAPGKCLRLLSDFKIDTHDHAPLRAVVVETGWFDALLVEPFPHLVQPLRKVPWSDHDFYGSHLSSRSSALILDREAAVMRTRSQSSFIVKGLRNDG
jgi:hypothetical protein